VIFAVSDLKSFDRRLMMENSFKEENLPMLLLIEY